MTHNINNNYNTNLTDAPDKLKLLLIYAYTYIRIYKPKIYTKYICTYIHI